jgi:hypothetical protein
MIKVVFNPPDTEAWRAWRKKAELATGKLIKAAARGDALKVSDALYKQCRNELFAPFHNKCAYCEDRIVGTNQNGDVEHFRPKKAVHEADGSNVMISDGNGGVREHPGYFWLAYHWLNLLPSCILCNQLNRTAAGELVGKGNRFPIKPGGKRAFSPSDKYEDEDALLLHPVLNDPAEHLIFDPKIGALGGTTEQGRETIRLLGLNRDGLLAERRNAYNHIVMIYAQMIMVKVQALMSGAPGSTQFFENELADHVSGKAPFSFAGRVAINDAKRLVASP